jgi:hypothetical protein
MAILVLIYICEIEFFEAHVEFFLHAKNTFGTILYYLAILLFLIYNILMKLFSIWYIYTEMQRNLNFATKLFVTDL